ncbi:hypothetical protein P106B_11 [Rhizobium phage vB_RglS_P106B]|uniref:Uncharacterized protein n=1 Tax=Rhizobium phage vB_RglS_P106B TaxID=1458697 RepID=W6E8J1_9CAUD|nr:hypothetical protein P106B_11 [Rhizobium phage vB_RglS_P106B]AHJ10694.1 hypothetical protein P106B_11 [Rhizobium phage vB_RglS_P106B]
MNAITIEGRTQFTVAAGAQSAPLEAGIYDVWAAADAYIKVGETANDVTSATGYLIPGGAGIVPVRVGRSGLRIGATADIAAHRTE